MIYDYKNLNAKCYFAWSYELDGYVGIVVKKSQIILRENYDQDHDKYELAKLMANHIRFGDFELLNEFESPDFEKKPIESKYCKSNPAKEFENDILIFKADEYRIMSKVNFIGIIIKKAVDIPHILKNKAFEKIRSNLIISGRQINEADMNYLDYLREIYDPNETTI